MVNEIETTLRSVIENLIDGQEGFQRIGENLKDEALKRHFLEESLTRSQFRGDLESLLHQEGIRDINEKGTTGGAVRRAWVDLKAGLGGGDHTLLVTAEQVEDDALEAYRGALEHELSFPVRQLLVTQAAHIQTSHDFVRAARDASK
jgi:uncharacterized protein (TIGR02284 family)